MKFRIQTIKKLKNIGTFNPQLKTWWLGSWKSIIYFPNDFSGTPFEEIEDGSDPKATKEQAQGVIDAYKQYNNLK